MLGLIRRRPPAATRQGRQRLSSGFPHCPGFPKRICPEIAGLVSRRYERLHWMTHRVLTFRIVAWNAPAPRTDSGGTTCRAVIVACTRDGPTAVPLVMATGGSTATATIAVTKATLLKF